MEQMMEPMLECLLAIMAETKASQEQMTAKMDAHQERMEANMNAWRNKMKASREVTQAYPKRTEARIETNHDPMEAKLRPAW
jgi:hypothetical protein